MQLKTAKETQPINSITKHNTRHKTLTTVESKGQGRNMKKTTSNCRHASLMMPEETPEHSFMMAEEIPEHSW